MDAFVKFLITFMVILFGVNISFGQDLEVGKSYYGFKLIEKKFVKEVNSECYLFEHTSSGAKLLKIANSDANKTFMISFKTTPESDNGAPHIMEHSVLNGSKSFPVKSPFDVLMKGSLNTFINAMTGNDRTIYPIASMNKKDYFNLMNVYLDAVFNPMIYEDKRILEQEGWHYELKNKDEAIVYRGIVYNEMKGAYSSATRELDYQTMKSLFPDIFYKYSSGGYPSAIPELTYEDFLNFHKKYYHPSNCKIVVYGDADILEELSFINDRYLKNYTSKSEEIEYPIQKSFESMKEVTGVYSAGEGSKTEKQTYLSLSYVTGLGKDQKLDYALNILAEVLVRQETAPIRKGLEAAGIGKDVSADASFLNQNVFSFVVQNADEIDKDKFKEIILGELKKAAEKGFEKEAVEGALNRLEFRTRELNTPQLGLSYGFRAVSGWNYGGSPFLTLEYEKIFKELREEIGKGYLEKVVKEYFVDNGHSVLLVLKPEPGLEKKRNAELEQKLKDYKATLSEAELENIVKRTDDLIKYQKEENTAEALATIPILDLKDIDVKAKYFELGKGEVLGVPVLKYEVFTNDVVYLRQIYDMRTLPQDLIQYGALLTDLLGSLSTDKYSYGELEKNLNIHTGGFNAYMRTYLEKSNDGGLIPKFIIDSKCINNKGERMLGLAAEIVTGTKFEDKERLKSLLVRMQSNLEARVKSDGYEFANNRLKSYFSKEGMFTELTSGIEYYWFLTDLVKGFEANGDAVMGKLKKASELLFNKNNATLLIVSSGGDYKDFYNKLSSGSFLKGMKNAEVKFADWNFLPEKKNEGFLTASKVQYVLQGYNFKMLGYEWSGKMRVLNQILMRDYLYTQIRLIGGAYGGRSSIQPWGELIFGSYRDPNLKKTLENYSGAVEYLEKFNPTDVEMKRYIIGTVARLDMPFSPLQQGNMGLRYYYEKTSEADIQRERDEVLSTNAADIKGYSGMIKAMLGKNFICVYGNEGAVNENAGLFNTVLKIVR